MKKILLSLFVIVSVFALTACVDINFDNFVGEGVLFDNFNGSGILRICNDSSYTIKAFVAYSEVNGEYGEVYRNDGVYEGSESPNIKPDSYKDYEVASGDYDIWFYMIADGYWYYTEKEDVYVYYNNTTEVSIEDGRWTLLVPSKASSMYDKLPEVVKTYF